MVSLLWLRHLLVTLLRAIVFKQCESIVIQLNEIVQFIIHFVGTGLIYFCRSIQCL